MFLSIIVAVVNFLCITIGSVSVSLLNLYFTTIVRTIIEIMRNIHIVFYVVIQAYKNNRWAYSPSEVLELGKICCSEITYIQIEHLFFVIYLIHFAILFVLFVIYYDKCNGLKMTSKLSKQTNKSEKNE
jgi:hypothetical protein